MFPLPMYRVRLQTVASRRRQLTAQSRTLRERSWEPRQRTRAVQGTRWAGRARASVRRTARGPSTASASSVRCVQYKRAKKEK